MADTYDVIICGAGSGGGFLAGEIAANASVLLLDAGAHIQGTPNPGVGAPDRRKFATQMSLGTFVPDGIYSLKEGTDSYQYPLYANQADPTSQTMTREAKVVGGGSFVNVGAWIRPRRIDFDGFAQETGVTGWTRDLFEPHFQRAERILSVHRDVRDNWNQASILYEKAARAMGIPVFETASNRQNCIFCGHRNNAGMPCKYDALMSTAITQIPKAVAAGAKLVDRANVVRVEITDKKATGVTYVKDGQTITANARKLVVVSAGAIGTPLILLGSNLYEYNVNVGKHLRAHPGLSIEGVMPGGEWGTDRGYQWNCHHYGMDANGQPLDTLVFSSSFPNTSWLAAQVGLFGIPYKNLMRQFRRRVGVWMFLLKPDMKGEVVGRVRTPVVNYPILGENGLVQPKALADTVATLRQTAGILRQMGAVALDPNPFQPTELLYQLLSLKLPAAGLFHSQGTCRAGADQKTSVVDSNCMSHDIKNLMCCDASVIPNHISANSNAMVMAVASRAADYVNSQILGVTVKAASQELEERGPLESQKFEEVHQ